MAFDQRAYQRAYYATEKGKESRRRALQKYNATPKARQGRKAWFKSNAGKRSLHKYYLKLTTILHYVLKRILKRHHERWPDVPSTLTFDDLFTIWKQQDGCCALSGIKMTWGKGVALATSISVDRQDVARGYHADNIRFLCHNVNAFRGIGTDEEMITMARA